MRQDLTKDLMVSELIDKKLSIAEFTILYNTSRLTIIKKSKEYGIYDDIISIRKKKAKKKNSHDLSGLKFGKITALERTSNDKFGKSRWICSCECGRKKVINASSLIRNLTKSCGKCEKINFTGYEGVSGAYLRKAQRSAEQRDIKFQISAKDIWEIYLLQNKKCAFTGLDIEFTTNNDKNADCTASIDRIDSNKDYTRDNIQIVHKRINLMKSWLDTEEFLYLCKLTYLNNQSVTPDNLVLKTSWRKNANL